MAARGTSAQTRYRVTPDIMSLPSDLHTQLSYFSGTDRCAMHWVRIACLGVQVSASPLAPKPQPRKTPRCRPSNVPGREYDWERGRDWDDSGAESGADIDDSRLSPDAAGDILVEMLLDLHYAGQLSAQRLCTICWWASKAGCKGPCSDFAYSPKAQTRKFQRHIDKVTNARAFFRDLHKI